LPWKIVRSVFSLNGCIEMILEPRKDKKGKPVIPAKLPKQKKGDAVELSPKKGNK